MIRIEKVTHIPDYPVLYTIECDTKLMLCDDRGALAVIISTGYDGYGIGKYKPEEEHVAGFVKDAIAWFFDTYRRKIGGIGRTGGTVRIVYSRLLLDNVQFTV